MRRLILAGCILLLPACSPGKAAEWLQWFSQDPVAASDWAHQYEQTRATATAGRPCSQWYDLAWEAGFSPEQWRSPLSGFMFRESRCNPSAKNPSSSASGLLQIVKGTWLSSCKDLPYEPFDPALNLQCAFRLWKASGWSPWAL